MLANFRGALGGVFCGDFPQSCQKRLTTEDTESTEEARDSAGL
jgi:hypothetical protein